MSFLDTLPENISVEEPVRVCASADLLPDGSFGKQRKNSNSFSGR